MDIKVLLGKILSEVSLKAGEDVARFKTIDGLEFVMYHDQDCCELVDINDVIGDINDLIGSPIIEAEEVVYQDETPEGVTAPEYTNDSFTWTFYKLGTRNGSVTIRWYGASNGYYSEDVTFKAVEVKA